MILYILLSALQQQCLVSITDLIVLLGNCSCQSTKIFHFPKKRKLGTLIGLRPEHDNIQIKNKTTNKMTRRKSVISRA